MDEIINKWQNIAEEENSIDLVLTCEMFRALGDNLKVKEFGEEGVLFYIIQTEFNQELCFGELFLYIRKENRGSIKLLNTIKSFMEEEARATNCDVIKIGANFGSNDDKFKRVLERWGFVPDTYRKEIL